MDRMANQAGLALVKVKKEVLLAKLKENLTSHVDEYNTALEGFHVSVVDELKLLLKKAKAGDKIKRNIQFDEPSCHEEDYKTVIEMLEMSVDDEVYLTSSEFKQYVQDQWHWKEGFSMTNMKYIS